MHWGVHEDVYCAGKESTFSFLEGVLKEVISLFPSQYIHIGGDEVLQLHAKPYLQGNNAEQCGQSCLFASSISHPFGGNDVSSLHGRRVSD